MDPSIPLKITEFILFIASIHDFFNVMSSWCFVTRIGVIGETKKHKLVFQVLAQRNDDDRWVENFRILKSMLFHIVDELRPTLMKKNRKYINAILVEIYVSCVIYKLAHGCNFLICNELFTIGKSITSLVLHRFFDAVNVVFKKLISWPMGVDVFSLESFQNMVWFA
jgi:hypothetical protein